MDVNKENFICDLDQTLIFAEAFEDYDMKKYKHKLKQFKHYNMEDYYIIFERPYLQRFLDIIFRKYNVSIWTAATKDYATFIIDNIILKNNPERKIHWVFYRYHCDISNTIKNGTKDLSMLWNIYKITHFRKDNTVIIDDYDEVQKSQPTRTLVAPEFIVFNKNAEEDNYLLKVGNMLKNNNKINVNNINRFCNN